MSFETEFFGITGIIKTNMYVELSGDPVDPREVSVDPITGPAQIIDRDFGVTGTSPTLITWDLPSSDIKDVAVDHEVKLRIMYEKS